MLEFDGNKLKQLRVGRDMSQVQLATLVGKEKNHIWNYENGKATPPSDVLLNLIAIFGVSAFDLGKPKKDN